MQTNLVSLSLICPSTCLVQLKSLRFKFLIDLLKSKVGIFLLPISCLNLSFSFIQFSLSHHLSSDGESTFRSRMFVEILSIFQRMRNVGVSISLPFSTVNYKLILQQILCPKLPQFPGGLVDSTHDLPSFSRGLEVRALKELCLLRNTWPSLQKLSNTCSQPLVLKITLTKSTAPLLWASIHKPFQAPHAQASTSSHMVSCFVHPFQVPSTFVGASHLSSSISFHGLVQNSISCLPDDFLLRAKPCGPPPSTSPTRPPRSLSERNIVHVRSCVPLSDSCLQHVRLLLHHGKGVLQFCLRVGTSLLRCVIRYSWLRQESDLPLLMHTRTCKQTFLLLRFCVFESYPSCTACFPDSFFFLHLDRHYVAPHCRLHSVHVAVQAGWPGLPPRKKSGFSSGVDDLLVEKLWKLLNLAMSWIRQCVLDPPLQYSAAALRFSRSFQDETQTAGCHFLLKQRRHTLTRARNPRPSCAQSGTYIPTAFQHCVCKHLSFVLTFIVS